MRILALFLLLPTLALGATEIHRDGRKVDVTANGEMKVAATISGGSDSENLDNAISTTTCGTAVGTDDTGCAYVQAPAGGTTVAIDVVGTLTTVTLQFEYAADPPNASTGWSAMSCRPLSNPEASAVTSTSATGSWKCNASGAKWARVRASTFTSGTGVETSLRFTSGLTIDRAGAGGGGGGTSQADNTAVGSITGAGALYDNTPPTCTDGNVCLPVIDSSRRLKIVMDSGAISTLPNEGQQTMANSISVAVASDQSSIPVTGPLTDTQLRATPVPGRIQDGDGSGLADVTAVEPSTASQSLTVREVSNSDITSTGSIAALNDSVAITTNSNKASCVVRLSGSYTGTLTFQVSEDGTNFNTGRANGSGGGTNSSVVCSGTCGGHYIVPCAGFRAVRVQSTAHTSGTATINWRASSGSPMHTPTVWGSVSTSDPTYTNGVEDRISITTSGRLRTDATGTKSNNSAAPSSTNLGTLPAVAQAVAPSYTEGNQVAISTDLTGRTRVVGDVSLNQSGTANNVDIDSLPNEGQQTMANSVSVALASDQSAVPISDNGGSVTVDGTVGTALFSVASSTKTGAGVTVTGTSGTIAASNTSRRYFEVCADADNTANVHLRLGATAVTTDKEILPGACMSIEMAGGYIYTGVIDAISASGSQTVYPVEW